MSGLLKLSALLFLCAGCAKQPSLPADSKFNVTSLLNDTAWYGHAKALRLYSPGVDPQSAKRFDLLIVTDLDYPGFSSSPNPKTHNGCVTGDCTVSQVLTVFEILLKKGKTKIAELDKEKVSYTERTALTYRGNSGAFVKSYIYEQVDPGWIRVTKYDAKAGIVEGNFRFDLREDVTLRSRLENGMPQKAQFTKGMFRVKLTDVKLKE